MMQSLDERLEDKSEDYKNGYAAAIFAILEAYKRASGTKVTGDPEQG